MHPTIDHGNGIHTIDADYVRPRLTSLHLIESRGRAAFVDTATRSSLPQALSALGSLGLGTQDVDLVLLTHIHLDHAGGAGAMMQAFPNARLVVHPRGVRHMVDPTQLMAGVEKVYGEEQAQELYGRLDPVAPDRIVQAVDGLELRLGDRDLLFIDTPGHARHHVCVFDRASRGLFTGDTFGVSYRECDVDGRPFVLPSSSPVQFDPPALRASIARMMALDPEAVYLTHYGRLDHPATLAPGLVALVDAYERIGTEARNEADPDADAYILDALRSLLLRALRAHGCQQGEAELLEVWGMDLMLNAQGLAIWARAAAA